MGDGSAIMEADDIPRSIPGRAVEFDVLASHDADGPLLSPFRSWGERAISHLGLTGQVRVRLVRDEEMAALHERTTGISGTTDVLTFDLREDADPRDRRMDVDVVLCTDEARRQGEARGHDPASELTLYLVHALLHCLGHDDHDDDAFERMHRAEDEILRAIGLGDVFARPTREAGGET